MVVESRPSTTTILQLWSWKGPLPLPQFKHCGRGRGPFHDHNIQIVVVEGSAAFHDHTHKSVVVAGALSTTTYETVVVERLRLDSYLHVMPPRFLSTTNIGFLRVTYGREKPIF